MAVQLSPSSLDMELQMLQIIDDDESENVDKPELQSISLLLDYFIHELSCRSNFEFVQAVLKLFLKVYDLYILSLV
jgi:U3 small nucleolar RNA-associated protein 21